MIRVRTTKTGSGKTAVQVVNSTHQKTYILKHLGSASTKDDIDRLRHLGNQYIETDEGVSPLFPQLSSLDRRQQVLALMESIVVKPTKHITAYNLLLSWYRHCGFDQLQSEILRDFSIIRLFEPASKQRSISLLANHFLREYSPTKVYRELKTLSQLKFKAEKTAVTFARDHYNFTFTLVFYDVTTLYFESFTADDLRKHGFSKDNKSSQPQVVVGLVVDHQGFPVSYALFEGNTFEGHTMIPVISELKRQHQIKTLTVVADAGMVSFANMQALGQQGISYIVGARLGNLPLPAIQRISSDLQQTEDAYFTISTKWGKLVCDYSRKRAAKDKSDRLKQLTRAEMQISHPEKVTKRVKFVKTGTPTKLTLNQSLVHKAELLEGIKGYYTNLTKAKESVIVARYHDLWHIEKSFRMAKSDLLARPMFHHKRQGIEAHLLIVFVSLCLAKSLELKTNMSIKHITDLLWRIEDVEFVDSLTQDVFHKQTAIDSTELEELLAQIKNAY